mmetsp:Transcript_50625/g.141773  ORF Transcript_50625/g.141773 Transcript_50625/m.141773 type:complete len:464 (-) Transcript_50625:264-1655(-)
MELEAEELSAQHDYGLIMQQLIDNIENAEHEVSRKNELRSQTAATKAADEGDLAQTTKDREEDQTYLDDMTALCEQKAADFKSRQRLRAEEIGALDKAIEVISSSTVAGAGETHLPTLLQLRQWRSANPAMAMQLSNDAHSPLRERAAAFLAGRAQRTGSRLLSEAALRAASDPFKKVKKLIKDLISKLMEEGTSETEHKGWCDAELVANKLTRAARTQDVSQLSAEIEDLTATIAQLTQDIADLTAAVKELDEAMATSTAERSESKESNERTIKEAQEAQAAVEQAIVVVKDYYAKSAEATALVQVKRTAARAPVDDAPETFVKPYKGMLPGGGNVVDFLEVILTDFARLESETAAMEAAEQDAYKKFMFESGKDKSLKETEIKYKSGVKTDKEGALHAAKTELKATQEELEKANAYYEKLKPSCVDSGITYEERVKRRDEEIESLQDALKILAGQDVPLAA